MSKQKFIYLDHAATTPVAPEVLDVMLPYFSERYGNPGSLYSLGQQAKHALDASRKIVADILHAAKPEGIIFTGSGTESDNLAILGAARANKNKGKHIIISSVEHYAVLHAAEQLEKEGFEVTYAPVNKHGQVQPEEIEKLLRDDTILVSIMYANNEVGTINPIAKIGNIIQKRGILMHTDACQAAGALDLDVRKLHVDLLTFNGSKIYGPKGVGALYVRKGVQLSPIVYGGGQEKGLRSGTENIPAIVGLAEALQLSQKNKEKENKRLSKLRDMLIKGVLTTIPKTRLNGHTTERLPNNANITIMDIEGEAFLLYMDEKGIACSTGSACTSSSLEPSHVITAMGLPYEFAHGSIRFTLGRSTTKKDIEYVLKTIPPIVERLREISPVHLQVDPMLSSHPKVHQR